VIVGTVKSKLPASEVVESLKVTMACNCADFEILSKSSTEITFRHGAINLRRGEHPKRGRILIRNSHDGSQIDYEIEVYGFIKYWLYFISLSCCWLVFPPILAYRALFHAPRQVMCNLLKVALGP
jgi:hypothetical protein